MFKRFCCFINCKINKLLSLLALMIFVLILSSASARTITGVEVANFILNGYGKFNGDIVEDQKIQNVNARMSNWNVIADNLNEHERSMVLWL